MSITQLTARRALNLSRIRGIVGSFIAVLQGSVARGISLCLTPGCEAFDEEIIEILVGKACDPEPMFAHSASGDLWQQL